MVNKQNYVSKFAKGTGGKLGAIYWSFLGALALSCEQLRLASSPLYIHPSASASVYLSVRMHQRGYLRDFCDI